MNHEHPEFLWYNGKIVPWDNVTIHATVIPSLTSSVFEGIRAYWNPDEGRLYGFRFREHYERFADSIKLMRMNVPYSVDEFVDGSVETIRRNGHDSDAYLRPAAYSGRPHQGGHWMPDPDQVHDVFIHTKSWPSILTREDGIHCGFSSWTRIPDHILPPRIKCHANYANSRLASIETTINGYEGALILNMQGKVAEGPGACVMMVRRGKVITPPVTAGILESITRDTLIEISRDVLGLEVEERDIDRTELYVADEAFFCGTGLEVIPIASIDRYPLGDGQIGPLTLKIRSLYHDLVRGIDKRYAHWRIAI
jgi:branched-chain amino acid aminotransferase